MSDSHHAGKFQKEQSFKKEIENFHALHTNHDTSDNSSTIAQQLEELHSHHNPATVVEEKILDLMGKMKDEYVNVISIERDNAAQIMKLVHEEDNTIPEEIAISEKNLSDEMEKEKELKESYITDYMSSFAKSMTPVELNMYNMFSEFRMELEMTLCMERAKHKQAVEILTETHASNMTSLRSSAKSSGSLASNGSAKNHLCPSVISQPSVSYRQLAKPHSQMNDEEMRKAEREAVVRTRAFLCNDSGDGKEGEVDDHELAATTDYILQHPNSLVVSDDSPGKSFFSLLNSFIETSLDPNNNSSRRSSQQAAFSSSFDDIHVSTKSNDSGVRQPQRSNSMRLSVPNNNNIRRNTLKKDVDEDEMLARAMAMMHAGWM